MGLETANFIQDLVATNPLTNETKSQGDDHIRVIKAAVKGSFPTSTKAWYNPTSVVKTIDFVIVAANMNTTFLVDTTAASVTGTLPTLLSADAGWECFFIKTNTGLSSFWIAPPSGTLKSGDLAGLAKTRRVIPGVRCSALWTGTEWVVSRAVSVPVGTILDFEGSVLPVGYEWPNGQVLAGVSGSVYPDYFARKGSLTVSDVRDRAVFGRGNMGGADAGLLTVALSGVDGTVLGAVGGTEAEVLSVAKMPAHNHAATPTGTADPHKHFVANSDVISGGAALIATNTLIGRRGVNSTEDYFLGGSATVANVGLSSVANANTLTLSTDIGLSGGGGSHNNLSPAIVLNKILVVE